MHRSRARGDAPAALVSGTRIVWALIAALSFGLPIVWTLASPGLPDKVERPIAPEDSQGERLAIPFAEVSPSIGDERIHRVSLSSPSPIDILAHPEIRILFSLDELRLPHPATARLEVVGTPCAYETPRGSGIADGRVMTFVRAGRCRPGDSRATGELKLTVKMAGPGELRVGALALPADRRAGGLIYITDQRSPTLPGPPPAVRGMFVDYLPANGLTRASLLSYMWTGAVDSTQLGLGVAAFISLLFVGALLFPLEERSPDGRNRRQWLTRGATGAFCFAAAFALLYAIIVPPLQAADEPHFVVSYGVMAGRTSISAETNHLANITHYERIRFHRDEHFRPRDVGRPLAEMTDLSPQEMWKRSSLTAAFWTALSRMLPSLSAIRSVAVLRAIHALTFGLAVAIATVLMIAFCPVRYPQLLSFPFLFVPTLPFFGMQVSETAILTSSVVLFTATLIILFVDGERAHWVGFPLGVTAAALFATTRSSLPMGAMVAAVLLARAVLGPRERVNVVSKSGVFWGGFALGASLFFVIVSSAQLVRVTQMGAIAATRVRSPLSAFTWPTRPWFPWGIAAGGWFLETALTTFRSAVERKVQPGAMLLTRLASGTAASAVIVSIAGSLWWTYPTVDNIQGQHSLSLVQYIRQVEATMATVFRATQPSLFLSQSFWVGFGWLDTLPNEAFCSFLVVLTGLSLIGLLVQIAISGDARRCLWLAVFTGGSIVTLALSAAAALQLPVNLHGRYLIAWYVSMVGVCWTFPALAPSWRFARVRMLPQIQRPAVFIGLWIFVHAFSACFILQRYF